VTGVTGLLMAGVVLTVVSGAPRIVGGAVVGVVVGRGTGALEVVTGGWLVVGGRVLSGGGVEEEYVAIIHI
tara:strand:- start:1365 stop:1577 length:213 start_codon:yes stop_codon:yes gene_type:complete